MTDARDVAAADAERLAAIHARLVAAAAPADEFADAVGACAEVESVVDNADVLVFATRAAQDVAWLLSYAKDLESANAALHRRLVHAEANVAEPRHMQCGVSVPRWLSDEQHPLVEAVGRVERLLTALPFPEPAPEPSEEDDR